MYDRALMYPNYVLIKYPRVSVFIEKDLMASSCIV